MNTGRFELAGPYVKAERRRADAVQVGRGPGVDLRVVEPGGGVAVHLGGGGLEDEDLLPKERDDLLKNLPGGNRAEKGDLPKSAASAPLQPFQHPYYWAGFILIGERD